MLTADGQNIRKMKANGQDNKENDVVFACSPALSPLSPASPSLLSPSSRVAPLQNSDPFFWSGFFLWWSSLQAFCYKNLYVSCISLTEPLSFLTGKLWRLSSKGHFFFVLFLTPSSIKVEVTKKWLKRSWSFQHTWLFFFSFGVNVKVEWNSSLGEINLNPHSERPGLKFHLGMISGHFF